MPLFWHCNAVPTTQNNQPEKIMNYRGAIGQLEGTGGGATQGNRGKEPPGLQLFDLPLDSCPAGRGYLKISNIWSLPVAMSRSRSALSSTSASTGGVISSPGWNPKSSSRSVWMA